MAHSLTHDQIEKIGTAFTKQMASRKANGGSKMELNKVLAIIDAIATRVIEETITVTIHGPSLRDLEYLTPRLRLRYSMTMCLKKVDIDVDFDAAVKDQYYCSIENCFDDVVEKDILYGFDDFINAFCEANGVRGFN